MYRYAVSNQPRVANAETYTGDPHPCGVDKIQGKGQNLVRVPSDYSLTARTHLTATAVIALCVAPQKINVLQTKVKKIGRAHV